MAAPLKYIKNEADPPDRRHYHPAPFTQAGPGSVSPAKLYPANYDRIIADRKSDNLPRRKITAKLLHISMGMLALSFPWIFSQASQVWILATVATLVLLALGLLRRLRTRKNDAASANQRKSYSIVCFPLAIATLFSLAEGQPLLYLIPLLILTFADSMAALVGFFYGSHHYQSPDGPKTIEGSLTMFIITMSCVYTTLDIGTSLNFQIILLIAFNLAIVITLVEAISWRGLDNFTIPVAGFYLLQAYLPLNSAGLAAHAFMNSIFVIALLSAQKQLPQGR
jgi:phytol kinase